MNEINNYLLFFLFIEVWSLPYIYFGVCSYLPPLKEETISSMSKGFLPNEARRTLFKGKTFIFISKKQVGKNFLSENAETPIS